MDKNEVISAIKNLTLGDLAVLFGSGQKEDSSLTCCNAGNTYLQVEWSLFNIRKSFGE